MTSIRLWALVVSVLLILDVEGSVVLAALSLAGEPVPVTEGSNLTLTCNRITDDAPPLLAVTWYRNTEAIFQTVQGGVFPSNTPEYDKVSGRISVTTNKQNHKVRLQINSSLDEGTVLACSVEDYYSNNLTIVTDADPSDTTPANESLKDISEASTSTTAASISLFQCRDSGTEDVLIAISIGGWGVTIILTVAFLWCKVRSSSELTKKISKSDPVHSALDLKTSGSDVNKKYTSAETITGARGSADTSEYVSPKEISENADSGIHDGHTSTYAIIETSGSDTSNEYATSDVKSDVTGTNGSEMHNNFVIPYMNAETIVSDDHYEYATGGAQYSEDGQYSGIYAHGRPLYTDMGKDDSPYIQPVPDDLQTNIEEYITPTFVSTDGNTMINK